MYRLCSNKPIFFQFFFFFFLRQSISSNANLHLIHKNFNCVTKMLNSARIFLFPKIYQGLPSTFFTFWSTETLEILRDSFLCRVTGEPLMDHQFTCFTAMGIEAMFFWVCVFNTCSFSNILLYIHFDWICWY